MLNFAGAGARSYVVVDMEWNQGAMRVNHDLPHEIMEIGAVRLGADLMPVETRQWIVKPAVYKTLDKHIASVTGISPEELDQGISFPEAFAEFCAWCGDGACLCTWGRDDYPVLLRNTRFYHLELPFAPPVNVQMIYSHLLTDKPREQVGLATAMEAMGETMDMPAHRALNDALYTARMMQRLTPLLNEADPARLEALEKCSAEEALAARSDARSVPTLYETYDDLLRNRRMTAVRCPICAGKTDMRLNWFDSGHGRFMALCDCSEHGTSFAQMHLKRLNNNRLVMHQRAYIATKERVADVLARHESSKSLPKSSVRKATMKST